MMDLTVLLSAFFSQSQSKLGNDEKYVQNFQFIL